MDPNAEADVNEEAEIEETEDADGEVRSTKFGVDLASVVEWAANAFALMPATVSVGPLNKAYSSALRL